MECQHQRAGKLHWFSLTIRLKIGEQGKTFVAYTNLILSSYICVDTEGGVCLGMPFLEIPAMILFVFFCFGEGTN